MQAPTTTEGAPAGRDPQAPTCPACGAANAASATFCWRCYQAFGIGSSAAWPPPPAPAWPPASTPAEAPGSTRRRTGIGIAVSLVAVVLVAAAVAFILLRDSGVSFPETVAGLARSSDSQTEAASASFRTASEAGGLDADMAFYGEGGMPVLALAYIRWTDGAPGGADAAFDAFADGFTSGYGDSVLTTDRLVRTVDGVEYLCASVGGVVGAGLCLWQDEDVFWMLMDARPDVTISGTKRLAVTAHDAVG